MNELIIPADDLYILDDPISMTRRLRGKFVDKVKYLFDEQETEKANVLPARSERVIIKEFVERLKQSLIDLYSEKNKKISLPDLEIDGIDIEMTINNLAAEYGVEVEQ